MEHSSGEDPDGQLNSMYRWAPGQEHSERIYTESPGDGYSGGLECSGTTITTGQDDGLRSDNPVWSSHYIRDGGSG